jgi:hypothetical protein
MIDSPRVICTDLDLLSYPAVLRFGHCETLTCIETGARPLAGKVLEKSSVSRGEPLSLYREWRCSPDS